MKSLIYVSVLVVSFNTYADISRVFSPMAVSSKGQYVALEEFGYKEETKTFYSKVKLYNSWKNEYIGDEISVEELASHPLKLNEIREKAKVIAQDKFKTYPLNFKKI